MTTTAPTIPKAVELRARTAALLAATPDRYLVEALLDLEGKEARSADEDQARAWLLEEIEGRYPAVGAAMDAWSEDIESDLTYVEALIVALPEAALGLGVEWGGKTGDPMIDALAEFTSPEAVARLDASEAFLAEHRSPRIR